jgi:hypothetical protein
MGLVCLVLGLALAILIWLALVLLEFVVKKEDK